MKDRLPEHIEPLRLARNQRLLQGQLAISRMPRLAENLVDTAGDIDVELQFDVDSKGISWLEGHVVCNLELRCQRCMQTMDFPIDSRFRLAVVESEAEIELLGEEYEPLLLDDDLVSVAELVEDELLLALPIVPRHDEGDCEMGNVVMEPVEQVFDESETDVEKKNPFAVLADLKRKD